MIVRFTMLAAVWTLSSCASHFRREAYDANYQAALRFCGNPALTFQAAYNSGFNRQPMNSDWAQMCTIDVQATTQVAYRDGYTEGARNAPTVVEHRVVGVPANRRLAPASRVSECTFDSDCGGSGWHCRENICRGFGSFGEACKWNDECLSASCFGGTCRE